MLQELLSLDTTVFRWINSGLGRPELDAVMLAVSSPWPWSILGTAFALFALWRRSLRLVQWVLLMGAAVALSDVFCYHVLKPWVNRPRPCYALEHVRLVVAGCGGDVGFPSNHAANAMTIAVCLAWMAPKKWGVLAILLAFLIGFSRIYLGVHYPLDVLGAYAVGTAIAMTEWGLFRWAMTAWKSRGLSRVTPPPHHAPGTKPQG